MSVTPVPEVDAPESRADTSTWLANGITSTDNVIALMMRKGGAGKTTLTLLLLDALARMGLRVLAVDLDPQGNTSIGLGHKVQLEVTGHTKLGNKPIMTPTEPTVLEVIEADTAGVADDAIQTVDWGYDLNEPFHRGGPLFPGRIGAIGVIPSYRALEVSAATWRPNDLEKLATALLLPAEQSGIAPNARWDVVLIDTPPGGSLISIQAAKAAYHALLVTQAQRFGVEAIPETLMLVDDIRDSYRHEELNVLGLVFNEYTDRSQTQRNLMAQVDAEQQKQNSEFEVEVWKGRVPNYTVVDKSQNAEAPLSAFLTSGADRDSARKVCQVAEGVAIQLLEGIRHPLAAEVKQAWKQAWPANLRMPIVAEV
ncbi:ParA family protein [Sphaerimonospora cavernae]|uniref:ParA family protein n=1 Tax=Sphaerimonospora cavernae TaxID=1740611 RepID=A0ABV6U1J2_9ACTN